MMNAILRLFKAVLPQRISLYKIIMEKNIFFPADIGLSLTGIFFVV